MRRCRLFAAWRWRRQPISDLEGEPTVGEFHGLPLRALPADKRLEDDVRRQQEHGASDTIAVAMGHGVFRHTRDG